MANSFGVSFLPGVPQGGDESQSLARQQQALQEAIQLLELRRPSLARGRWLAPAPLVTAAGGMGQRAASGNVVAQALALLVGLPPATGAAPMSFTPPAPAVTFGHGLNPQRRRPAARQPGLGLTPIKTDRGGKLNPLWSGWDIGGGSGTLGGSASPQAPTVPPPAPRPAPSAATDTWYGPDMTNTDVGMIKTPTSRTGRTPYTPTKW